MPEELKLKRIWAWDERYIEYDDPSVDNRRQGLWTADDPEDAASDHPATEYVLKSDARSLPSAGKPSGGWYCGKFYALGDNDELYAFEAMIPTDLRAIRRDLGLSQAAMACELGLGANGARTVRRYESGEIEPSGPVLRLYSEFRDGKLETNGKESRP